VPDQNRPSNGLPGVDKNGARSSSKGRTLNGAGGLLIRNAEYQPGFVNRWRAPWADLLGTSSKRRQAGNSLRCFPLIGNDLCSNAFTCQRRTGFHFWLSHSVIEWSVIAVGRIRDPLSRAEDSRKRLYDRATRARSTSIQRAHGNPHTQHSIRLASPRGAASVRQISAAVRCLMVWLAPAHHPSAVFLVERT